MGFCFVNKNAQAGGLFRANRLAADAAKRRWAKRRAAFPDNAWKQ